MTYPYGAPVFSPSSMLSRTQLGIPLGTPTTFAADSGSGFVYTPEPTGTVVAEIDVADSEIVSVPFVLLGLTIFALDIILTILMKRTMRARPPDGTS